MSNRRREEVICVYVPRSTLVQYIVGEDSKVRHKRRYEAAFDGIDAVKMWCVHRSIRFTTDDISGFPKGRWSFRADGKWASWLPHLGKLQFKKNFKERRRYFCKIHDYMQLLMILEDWIKEL